MFDVKHNALRTVRFDHNVGYLCSGRGCPSHGSLCSESPCRRYKATSAHEIGYITAHSHILTSGSTSHAHRARYVMRGMDLLHTGPLKMRCCRKHDDFGLDDYDKKLYMYQYDSDEMHRRILCHRNLWSFESSKAMEIYCSIQCKGSPQDLQFHCSLMTFVFIFERLKEVSFGSACTASQIERGEYYPG